MGLLEDYIGMCEEGERIGDSFRPGETGEISNVVVCGMGGSGACGDLLVDVAKLDVPIVAVKDYNIPNFVGGNTLLFCISYSGNTEETLSQFVQAREAGAKIVSVTSGGKLKEWSEKENIPVMTIPSGRNPRDALPLMMFPVLKALQKMGMGDYERGFAESKEAAGKVSTASLDDLAARIKNARLAIYGTSDHTGSLRRMKNEFNENAKMAVMHDFFPEINHNEMNGYQRTGLSKNVDVVLMRDRHESEEMRTRIETTKGILEHYVNSINEVWCEGESKLARTMSFAFASSYLTGKIAELTGVNREKVPFVDRLKDALKKKLNTVEKLEKKL